MSTEVTKLLDRIAALEGKATPGEWSTPHFSRDEINCDCKYVLSEGHMGSVCTINANPESDDPPIEEAKANGALIAELRNSAKTLIALAKWALWVEEDAPHAYLCPASPLGNPVAIGPCNCWKSKRPAVEGFKL